MKEVNDLTLLSVRSAVDHLHATLNRAVKRIERQMQQDNAGLFSDIRQRKKLVRELALDQKLLALFKALSSSPSLDVTAAGEQMMQCQLSPAVVVHEGSCTKIRFAINERPYQIQHIDDGGKISFYGETFQSAHIALLDESGNQLLTLHLNIEGESSFESISVNNISGFVPGPWIYDVIHSFETLVVSEKLSALKTAYSDQSLDYLKSRFGIE